MTNLSTKMLAPALVLGSMAGAHAAPVSNPLLEPSTLPYQAPPFDRIHDADYLPAIDAAMHAHDLEIAAIAASHDAPTFDNTIVAMERSGAMLTRVAQIFGNITQSNTDDALDKAKDEIDPKLQAHQDGIFLNPRLFARVKAVHDQRAELTLDAKSQFLLEETYKDFVHAGAALAAADQSRLRTLNQQITKLQTSFQQKLLAATSGGAIIVDTAAELAGLDQAGIAAAAAAAKSRGHDGKFLLPLRNTTQQPTLEKLTDRALRTRIMAASESRGDAAGPNDVRDLVAELAKLRADKAKLLGLLEFRGLHTGKPDGQDARSRHETAGQPGPRRHRQGARRGRGHAGHHRQTERRLQTRRLRLELLRRAGTRPEIRPGRGPNPPLFRDRPRPA